MGPAITPPGIAQRRSSTEVLDQLSDLIPGVLVQTLSHPLRVVAITTFSLFSGQSPCPFVQAVNDPRSNPAREGLRTHRRRLHIRSARRFRHCSMPKLALCDPRTVDVARQGPLGGSIIGVRAFCFATFPTGTPSRARSHRRHVLGRLLSLRGVIETPFAVPGRSGRCRTPDPERVACQRPDSCAGQVDGRLPGSRRSMGGRPRLGKGPAFFGIRPASSRARRSSISIWALVLRNSSAAHRARAL